MSQQNFVEQFRLFMEYARKNSMHSRECMLWVSLFYLANEEATYNAETQTYEWPDDFFEVSNGELNSYGKFDKQAIESLRNRLKQRGLIDFIKGNRNSTTPMYKIHYFIRFGNKIIPNNHANNIPNNTPNHTPLRLNINNTIPGNPFSGTGYFDDEEDQEEEQRVQAQARACEEIRATWKQCFGREPTQYIVGELAHRFVGMGFEDGVLTAAIKAAAWSEAKSPMAFICSILVDWRRHNVRTQEDVDEYMMLIDMERGKMGEAASFGSYDRIKKFTEDRETPDQRESRERLERYQEEQREKQRALIASNQAARAANEA